MQHNFFQYGVAAFITLATVIGQSAGRELRPSDHGLAYQEDASPPTQNGDAQQMLTFFASSVPLPEAQDISDDTWRSVNGGDGKSRNTRRDHVRTALVVASASCGVAGVVLLVVSGIVFLRKIRKKKTEAERLSSNSELHVVNDK